MSPSLEMNSLVAVAPLVNHKIGLLYEMLLMLSNRYQPSKKPASRSVYSEGLRLAGFLLGWAPSQKKAP